MVKITQDLVGRHFRINYGAFDNPEDIEDWERALGKSSPFFVVNAVNPESSHPIHAEAYPWKPEWCIFEEPNINLDDYL